MKDKAILELVIVLVLVGFALWSLKKDPAIISNTTNDNQIVFPTDDKSPATTVPTTATISYAQALQKYKDARIQLNQDCQATPNNVTYKNNTNIMIDNRASVTRTVRVGSSFSIPAYGFKIVKLSSTTLPATWGVDCAGSQNVATILIQK